MSGFVFSEKPIQIERGDGAVVYDDAGTEYLDMGASYACVPLGHSHEAVDTAAKEQIDDLTYVQASYPVEARTRLYDTLAVAAPGDLENVWLCNSGTEANEAALKFARSATGDSKIVATMQGFHGRTMGALATTWKDKYKKPYEPLIGDVEFVPYDDSEALADAVDDETAAVIMEPIQGEGGIHPASAEYLESAREITDEAGAALIFDEVQTGMGRTGTLWACEQSGVVPDVLTTAKGLANGFPMGATLVADWIAEDYGSHASTFSGGPVVSAAAEATVSTLVEDDIPSHAADVGQYLRGQLREELGDNAREVRGEGLMIGVEIKRGANRVLKELAMDHQVLALPAGRTVVRLLPPLIVDEGQADAVVAALSEAID
ncbi:Acetylornithine-acetyl-lysine aminotransferase protein [Halorhabdus tiamatea SARL4B]|uniref:Putative [LysW]-aminoadipate semialdehyde/glutamate semialdehyde transaminase n=1 Tax=Halorhabdus tiamatea SARL4B TaxID=1033806 RepID=F7PNU5_9EURY|nr:aminotransferase class III-fold pyridoxal phosphate-dependent enzyme [Halorhabdus tiamatea]ERJ06747.1 Acetylornithine-acetyl-lysine aminotransferase protein [Halorhabdus tiamatea SARL4B]CCQ33669.1 acetylornithine aminotransferase; N-acetyl-lysine aminotransferase [Halorhabdus tiamatea SARL4B]